MGRAKQAYLVIMIAAFVKVLTEVDPLHPNEGSMAYNWGSPGFVWWVRCMAVVAVFTVYAVAREWQQSPPSEPE